MVVYVVVCRQYWNGLKVDESISVFKTRESAKQYALDRENDKKRYYITSIQEKEIIEE